MTSTVLDVTVMLLCVSASVVVLGPAGGNVGDRGPTADDVADRLVTETVTVTYESAASPNGTRTIHATRAELLSILVAEERRDGVDSGTNDAFKARSRAAITDGLGPRTRIDVRATTATEANETNTERSADWHPSKDPAASDRAPSTTGTPWVVELRGDRNDRPDRETGSTATDDRPHEPVTVGMEPPRNADVTTAIVTQPVPSDTDPTGPVRIVVRRW